MTGVDDGGVESTSRGGCGGRMEAAPRWGNVDGVTRERLHEGRRLWTMGGGGGGRRIRPRWAGMEILWLPLLSSSSASFCGGSTVGIIWREKKDFSREEWEISR